MQTAKMDSTIFSLPSEVILIILKHTTYPDIIRFGSTCKKFNELVKSSQTLWKANYRKIVHPDIMKHKNGPSVNWLKMLKKYMKLKRKLTQYLEEMSSVHYNNYNEVDLEDIRHFFNIALADDSSLGETIYILQDFVRMGNYHVNNNILKKPYSLTTVYYAKIVLRYLFQLYLVFVWGKSHLHHKQLPINVVNFFVQWVDPLHIHSQSEVMNNLEILKCLVKTEIMKRYPSKIKDDPDLENQQTLLSLTDDEIVNAITSVIYKQKYITLMPYTTLSTLDIVQVLKKHCGCVTAMGAIYQYIAQHFGLQCNLIVLPNHFILELDKRDDDTQVGYKIALDTGECRPKGRCPFTRAYFPSKDHVYCPMSLTQYIANEFLASMGGVRNWYTVNVEYLFEMVNGERGEHPYINLQKYIETHQTSPILQYDINYFNMRPEQLSLLLRFSSVENPRPPRKRGVTVKIRSNDLKYAVGMICYHRQYNYVCLIMQWDTTCFDTRFNPAEVRTLEFGIKQPFYHVIAMDQSERYVPQENLVEYNRPTRLYHLEDAIAKKFSHFNGFAYVPNDEKSKEYPEDTAISNYFKCQYELQNRLL